ncbi:MAG TPA: DinB family protein [Bacteroidota bacterium]|nr:DinB family protein [Bacteroidota bacterium]
MTLQEIKMLTAYSAWATHRLFAALEQMSPEDAMRDMKSSHGNIHGTLTHLVGAEKMWLSRMSGTPDRAMIRPAEVPTAAAVKSTWEQTGFAMAKFLGGMTDKKLQETFSFPAQSGEQLTYRFSEALQHVVNHATFHRGQVVAMMRQMGHTPPDTGLTLFLRETKKK